MTYRPRHKTARLAPYLMAIKEAHDSGWTWPELLNVVEDEGLDIADKAVNLRHTFDRAMRRYKKGTLKAKQVPLPGLTSPSSNPTEAGQKQQPEPNQEQQNNVGDRKGDPAQVDIEDYQSESQQESATDQNEQAPEPEPESDPDDDDGPSLQERFAEKLKSRNNSNQ